MADKMIGVLFLDREIAHRAHLKTRSYAQHVALGSFYTGVIDLADTLAEAYQGRNGLIKDIPYLDADESSDIVGTLKNHLKMIEDMRYDDISESDSTLQNIVDEIISLYLSTIYKLRFLG